MMDTQPINPLVAFSDHTAELVARVAPSVVGVEGGSRFAASGIHWRPGVIVTAEERLEADEGITVILPGGRRVSAALAGRDPTTDVAVLRVAGEDSPTIAPAPASPLRAGALALAVGNRDGVPVAHLGIASFVAGPWHSMRGGAIESLIRIDLALSAAAEGGALADAAGHVRGMVVSGPRGRVLAIPRGTIDRAVDQLLAKGRVARGYLGAGLQPVRLGRQPEGGRESRRGLLVASLDPQGPAAQAGLLMGDIVTGWNGAATGRMREVLRLLGPESVGTSLVLDLIRAGVPAQVTLTIGERPSA